MWGLLLVSCNSVQAAVGWVLSDSTCWVVGDMPDSHWKEKQYPQRRNSIWRCCLAASSWLNKGRGRKPWTKFAADKTSGGWHCNSALPSSISWSCAVSRSLGLQAFGPNQYHRRGCSDPKRSLYLPIFFCLGVHAKSLGTMVTFFELACWNVRTICTGILNDLEEVSDLGSLPLLTAGEACHQCNCSLSETRLADTGSLHKMHYTFFWHEKGKQDPSENWLGSGVKNLLARMVECPHATSEHILSQDYLPRAALQ